MGLFTADDPYPPGFEEQQQQQGAFKLTYRSTTLGYLGSIEDQRDFFFPKLSNHHEPTFSMPQDSDGQMEALRAAFSALGIHKNITASSFRVSGDLWTHMAGGDPNENNYLSQWSAAKQADGYKRPNIYRLYAFLYQRETGRPLLQANYLRSAPAPYVVPRISTYQSPLETGIGQKLHWAYAVMGMAFGAPPSKGLSLRERVLYVRDGFRRLTTAPSAPQGFGFTAGAVAAGAAAAAAGASAGGGFIPGTYALPPSALVGAAVGAAGAAAIALGPGVTSGAWRIAAIAAGAGVAALGNFFSVHWAFLLLVSGFTSGALAFTHILLKG